MYCAPFSSCNQHVDNDVITPVGEMNGLFSRIHLTSALHLLGGRLLEFSRQLFQVGVQTSDLVPNSLQFDLGGGQLGVGGGQGTSFRLHVAVYLVPDDDDVMKV